MEAAITLFNRLTEVEKMRLRSASPDRIEYLADTAYLGDLNGKPFEERVAIVIETTALVNLEFASKSMHPTFGLTWKF